MPGDGGGGGHGRGDEVGAAAFALAAFEVAVAGAGAALARLQLVGIHRQAHRAARFAPFETSLFENSIESFLLRLPLYLAANKGERWSIPALGVLNTTRPRGDRGRNGRSVSLCYREHDLERYRK